MSPLREWSAAAGDVPPGTTAKFPLEWRGTTVEGFVVNVDGRYHAYVNRCAHAGTPLDWWPNEFFTDDGQLLVCATHGALFEPDSGRCAGGPCSGGALWPLAVRLERDRVIVSARPEDASGAAGS
jgi:nitrite reductase/ring-hydroxylating ferredoxin subunit